ncbi:hypothetical protein Xbed_02847 [Xenorhabdus beddingii]|uniref:Uncharacterized protein n=1 Tax=Xenorhabdus beddingii TaxID=40578 RepID=A0A1Y2SJ74_9GAMM|nr:hypothetical protein Xbed_02847 [Xenorhabdus beddingii]
MAAWVIHIPLAIQGNGQRNIAFIFRVVLIVQYYSLVICFEGVYVLLQIGFFLEVVMSERHQDIYNELRQFIRPVLQYGVRSLAITGYAQHNMTLTVLVAYRLRNVVAERTISSYINHLGFYATQSRIENRADTYTLAHHAFNITPLSYEQDILPPIVRGEFVNFDQVVAHLFRHRVQQNRPIVHNQVNAWVAHVRNHPTANTDNEQDILDCVMGGIPPRR